MPIITIARNVGKVRSLKVAQSTTVAKGMVLVLNSDGYLEPATSSTSEAQFIAEEAVVSTTNNPEILVTELDETILLEGDTTNNTAQTQIGEFVDLTDASTIDNGASTEKVFFVTDIVGEPSDKKLIVRRVSKDQD